MRSDRGAGPLLDPASIPGKALVRHSVGDIDEQGDIDAENGTGDKHMEFLCERQRAYSQVDTGEKSQQLYRR